MIIKDDIIRNITDDIEKVQAKPTMYISFVGEKAYEHLVHELLDNVKDEKINPKTVSTGKCTMLYDEAENMFYIEDDGRGVQFEELENICTILHSGSKMTRANGTSSGENGVGLTVTNALSEVFEITSMRNGQMRMLQYKNGQKTMDNMRDIPKNKHGLIVAFSPNKILLGKNCVLPIDHLKGWLLRSSFFFPEGLEVKFTVEPVGKEVSSTTIYKNEDGITGFLSKVVPQADLLKTPVVLKKTTLVTEEVPIMEENKEIVTKSVTRHIDVEVAFNYVTDEPEETIRYSFCNTLENIEHGEHNTAVTNCLIAFFRQAVKASSSKITEVTNQDILTGLCFVVNINTDLSVGLFTSQTKHKLDNKIVYTPIWEATMDALETYFKLPENRKILNAIIGVIRTNISARLAAVKSRKRSKKQPTLMDTTDVDGYIAPNNLGDPNYNCELYIVEGDSAGSSAAIARYDNNIQGVFGMTGKPPNTYTVPFDTLSQKGRFSVHKQILDDILGTGYGPNFDINNLLYDKIILSPDADIDGDHMAGLLVAIFYRWAPDLIRKGHVYRVITPLYQLGSKQKKKGSEVNNADYIFNKKEYFERYTDVVYNVFSIKDIESDRLFTKAQMLEFLSVNQRYYSLLKTISRCTVHPDIIEWMVTHKDWSKISKTFDEMTYDKESNTIIGTYKEEHHSVTPYAAFTEQLNELSSMIDIYNDGRYQFELLKKIRGQAPESLGILTIGQIIKIFSDYEPEILSRFKGLGELDPLEFYHLVMNPKKRKLIRLTMNDAEEVNKYFDELFLDSQSMRLARKKLVENTSINVEDIDN